MSDPIPGIVTDALDDLKDKAVLAGLYFRYGPDPIQYLEAWSDAECRAFLKIIRGFIAKGKGHG